MIIIKYRFDVPSYIIRELDPSLWARVKARAEKDGYRLRWVILSLLTYYASKGMPK